MNADRFLALYDRVAEAPDAIARLRRFVLDLAVRGKLVAQEPTDEPASELLKRIKAERTRREREKSLKPHKLAYGPIALETGVATPPNWALTTIGETCELQTGATPDRNRSDYFGGEIPWLVSGDINRGEIVECDGRITEAGLRNSNCKVLPRDCVLIALNGQGKTRASVALLRIEAACNQSLVAIIPLLSSELTPEFIHLSLKARYVAIRELTGKDERRGLNMRLLDCFEIPIPPFAEQRRIVARVEELMALMDRLEDARQQREATRDRLTTASLALLNAHDPSTLQKDAHFALEALPAFITRRDQIHLLRRTILDLAVRGKLVEQDPSDEPPSLGSRIDGDPPFDPPPGWLWTPFSAVAVFENGDRSKKYPNRSEYVVAGVPWINTGHIETDGTLSHKSMHFITEEKFASLGGGKVRRGDLVYCLRGATFGKTAFVDPYERGAIASSLMIIRPLHHIDRRYAFIYLTSPLGRDQLQRFDNGTAQPNLSSANVKKYHVPLPPLTEQHRIVAKVDALMALCERLEGALTTAESTCARLLEALLNEALEPPPIAQVA